MLKPDDPKKAAVPSKIERRRYPRVAVDLSVKYKPAAAAKGARVREDRLMSLGEGGAYVQTKLTYPPGTRLELMFEVEKRPFQVQAQVAYSVAFNPKVEAMQFPGMGLQFLNASREMCEIIRKFVAREQLRQELGVPSH